METTCPRCGQKLQINMSKSQTPGDDDISLDIFTFIMTGKQPYKGNIEALGDGKYKFKIQVYDSPDGDVWVSGVALAQFPKFEILEIKAGEFWEV